MHVIRRILILALLVWAGIATTFAFDTPEYTIVKETKGSKATALVVHYQSINADCTGSETLSGLITIPNSGQAVAMVLDNHYTMTKNSDVPSMAGSVSSATLFESSMVVVAPDYLGYGCTVAKGHPYLCHHQNAVSSIDLSLVARDIVMRRGVSLELDALFNFGYSQGGGVAMAVHREMELDKELAHYLHFVKSYCGAGPYDLAATLEASLSQDELNQPCLLPLVVKGVVTGFPQCFAEGRTFADFFRPELIKAGLEKWIDDKKLSSTEISNRMLKVTNDNHSARAFLNESFNDEQSTLMQELLAVADADLLLDGWKPSFPIKLYHQPTDELVPFVNTKKAIAALGLKESEQVVTSVGLSHSDYGTIYYLLAYQDMQSQLEKLRKSNDDYYLDVPALTDDNVDAPLLDLQGRPVGPGFHGIAIRGHQKVWIDAR